MKKKNKSYVDQNVSNNPPKQDAAIIFSQPLQIKINYLSEENTSLKNKILDLQSLLKQKEDVLKLIHSDEGKFPSSKVSTDLSNKFMRSNMNNNKEFFPYIFESLYSENQKLYEVLERISKEKDEVMSKVPLFF